ncbi:MAG: acetamidase/formamidase family protein [Gaiellaceae bacterium]
MIYELPLERRTLHGHFSRELEPVAAVDPGDTIGFACLNAGWRSETEEQFEPRDPELDSGHALIGPVEVRGARAGQTLVVRIGSVRPGSWGTTLGNGASYDWDLAAGRGVMRQRREVAVELRPFLGVLGMPPPAPGRHSTIPPRAWGGNIDCKELVAGTTLYLPIPVDGAFFSAGDGHARQGDGEVSGTAIECPLARAELTLDLRDDLRLETPLARTGDAWLAFGFDEDLDRAADQATEAMLGLLRRERGIGRSEALALASVVVDLRVTQVVNEVKGIHAILADDALR